MANISQKSRGSYSIRIRLSRKSDLRKYSSLIQESAEKAYTNAKLGYTKNLFSKKVFASQGLQNWMKSNLYPKPKKKTWVAFSGSRMVGAMTAANKGKRSELRALYIATDMQGRGIGKQLFIRALEFSKGKDALLVMYPHNLKTFRIYKRWGFKKYGKAGSHHWSSWPEGKRMGYIYMLLTKVGVVKLHKHLLNK